MAALFHNDFSIPFFAQQGFQYCFSIALVLLQYCFSREVCHGTTNVLLLPPPPSPFIAALLPIQSPKWREVQTAAFESILAKKLHSTRLQLCLGFSSRLQASRIQASGFKASRLQSSRVEGLMTGFSLINWGGVVGAPMLSGGFSSGRCAMAQQIFYYWPPVY